MKILVICEKGINRSATLAFRLKYLGHDVLTAGLETNDGLTIDYLVKWADKIICTDKGQKRLLDVSYEPVELWDIGPDVYRDHHFDKKLLKVVDRLVAEHRAEL